MCAFSYTATDAPLSGTQAPSMPLPVSPLLMAPFRSPLKIVLSSIQDDGDIFIRIVI